jgi:polyisoprenoid-binding protein YceI
MKRLLSWPVFLAVCCTVAASTMAVVHLQKDLINDQAQSTMTFVLKHPLHTVRSTSQTVRSTVSINNKIITAVEVMAPIKSFDSGNKTRDKDMLEVTEAALYPEVKFTSSRITSNGNQLTVTGQVYFHGVRQNVTFEAEQQLTNKKMIVNGSFPISLEAFKVKRPSIFGMAVKDEVLITFHMVYPLASAGT